MGLGCKDWMHTLLCCVVLGRRCGRDGGLGLGVCFSSAMWVVFWMVRVLRTIQGVSISLGL